MRGSLGQRTWLCRGCVDRAERMAEAPRTISPTDRRAEAVKQLGIARRGADSLALRLAVERLRRAYTLPGNLDGLYRKDSC